MMGRSCPPFGCFIPESTGQIQWGLELVFKVSAKITPYTAWTGNKIPSFFLAHSTKLQAHVDYLLHLLESTVSSCYSFLNKPAFYSKGYFGSQDSLVSMAPPMKWVLGGCFPEGKRRGCKAHRSHPLVTKLRTMELHLHSSIRLHGMLLN
jgi:hypothetical protein